MSKQALQGREWPAQPEAMTKEIDDHLVSLRHAGITVERGRRSGGNRNRFIRLERVDGDTGMGDA
jgi:hypothetical protein